MALNELEKRLYRDNETFKEREFTPTIEKPEGDTPTEWNLRERAQPRRKSVPDRTKKLLWWSLGIIGILLITVGGLTIYLFTRSGVNVSKAIELTIDYPREVGAGEKTTWTVRYKNTSPVAIDSAELTFEFPDRTLPPIDIGKPQSNYRERISIGRIPSGAEGEYQFVGVLFGSNEEILKGRAILEYRPEDSSARFEREFEYEVKIVRSQLNVAVDVPQALSGGQETEIKIKVTSNSDVTFKNLSVGMQYPDAFEFVRARPTPSEGKNIWKLGDIEPGEERIISIFGRAKNETADPQTFRARIGLREPFDDAWTEFATGENTVGVSEPFLSITSRLENDEDAIVHEGDILQVTLVWKNNLKETVSKAFVETTLDGAMFDLSKFNSVDGTISGNTIKWVSGRTPQLELVEPGEDGRLSFSVGIKDPIPVASSKDRDISLQIRSVINAPNPPQGYEGTNIEGKSNLTIRIATDLTFKQEGLHFDSRISNTGPIPPQVGRETTYTIVWSLVNRTSDIRNLVVEASLPTYVEWKGVVVPSGEDVRFDSSTGKIRWNIPLLQAGAGILRPPLEAAFKVGITPSIVHIGTAPELISEAKAIGRDAFTNLEITEVAPKETTAVKADAQVRPDQESVVE